MRTVISRRNLLKTGSAVIVGFAFGARNSYGQGSAAPAAEVDSFLIVKADGSVTLLTSHVDVGTGLRIAYKQIAAEELGIPVDRFTIVEGDTSITPDHGGTGGSSGIPRGGVDIRRAAATARQAILELASKQMGLRPSELTIENGEVRPGGLAVASIIGGKRFTTKVSPNVPVRNPAKYAIVGQPLLRSDVAEKATASHAYLHDFSVAGMMHGRVVRPPVFGAKLESIDESSIKQIPDVRVVRIESFLGVVTRNEWAAVRAARELKATWSQGQPLQAVSEGFDVYARTAPASPDISVLSRGNVDSALPTAAKQLSASYYWPFQSHASLGPSCSIADYKADGVTTVWSSTQGVFGQRALLSKVFGIPLDKMRVVYLDGSGSYGTNGANDADADALLLSRAVGAPVRVQWSRQDELAWDPKGPAQTLELRGGIDASGNIVAWDVNMWLPSGPSGERALLGPEAAGMAQEKGQNAGLMTQNADPGYTAPNVRVVAHNHRETPLRLSNLRAPGKIANVFASEGFADEMAAAAGMDALEFRRRGLTDPRAIAVLDRAAAMLSWDKRPSPNPKAAEGASLNGRGIAYMRYKQTENYVAVAMEVAVDRGSGAVSIKRVTCAHDCGLIINPDGLRNQIEGNIVQTLSRTLHEETRFDRTRVTSVDWNSYPLLRFPELPPIEVAMINHPSEPPFGAGEAASAPVPAALANAIFDATGVRMRTAPITTERMKAALGS